VGADLRGSSGPPLAKGGLEGVNSRCVTILIAFVFGNPFLRRLLAKTSFYSCSLSRQKARARAGARERARMELKYLALLLKWRTGKTLSKVESRS